MIKDTLNGRLMFAMKINNKIGVNVLRDIKTSIMNWETSKENVGKTLSEGDEIKILKKLKSQYLETAEACNDGKHDDLVNEAIEQAKYIEQFLPQEATPEDIQKCVNNCGLELIKPNMGKIIKYIKECLPSADGKMIADIVKQNL